MKQLTDLQSKFNQEEILSNNDLDNVRGGICRDDKRRQRPGGGSSNTSLFKERTLIDTKIIKTSSVGSFWNYTDNLF